MSPSADGEKPTLLLAPPISFVAEQASIDPGLLEYPETALAPTKSEELVGSNPATRVLLSGVPRAATLDKITATKNNGAIKHRMMMRPVPCRDGGLWYGLHPSYLAES